MPSEVMPSDGFVRTISLDQPRLGNNISDAQRLEHGLKKELGIESVEIPLHVLKKLPVCLRSWQFQTKVVLFKNRHTWMILDIIDPHSDKEVFGIAIDIGTTRIVMALINLESKEQAGEIGFDNPQTAIGPDVLSRIHHTSDKAGIKNGSTDGLAELNSLVIGSVNQHLSELCDAQGINQEDIYIITGAGNTAMTHFFIGLDTMEIIKEPYIPCVNIIDSLKATQLGIKINPHGSVFFFPNIGSYFGGDLIAGILYSDLDKKQNPSLMVDVGTNAEIVVGNCDWLIACAGAAGPALEGGVSKMGMTANPGVIDKVWIDGESKELHVHTIEEMPPIGICGSGMIDLAASLFLSGRIDIRGKFVKEICKDRLIEKEGIQHYILVEDKDSGTRDHICLSQVDLNLLTSSKAAMYTILEVIVKDTAGLVFEDLSKFYVAGTFGSFINPVSAISIGMLPDIPIETFEALGNSSLGGAIILLKDPDAFDRVMQIRQSITYIELNVNQEFMNMFSGAKFYPHTDVSRFPSLIN